MDILEKYLSHKICHDYHRVKFTEIKNEQSDFKLSFPITKVMNEIYSQLEKSECKLSFENTLVFNITFELRNNCEIIKFSTIFSKTLLRVTITYDGSIHIHTDPYTEIINDFDENDINIIRFIKMEIWSKINENDNVRLFVYIIQKMSVININVGILGHVDSGKTSLCKALSTTASTACFDKNPQSKERGITLDLGFSSFQVLSNEIPQDIKTELKIDDLSSLQYTLVDCPGHASLIRTIICGAQIIDLMVLVIDVTKGMQTQSAECLVIGEILCDKLLVVLNKIDLIPEGIRDSTISRMKKRLNLTLAKTKFGTCSIIEMAANPGDNLLENCQAKSTLIGLDGFRAELLRNTENPILRRLEGSKNSLIFSIDHCFSIRGQGTVLTGTVLSGTVEVGEMLYVPSLDVEKKIKSIQMFRKPVTRAIQGDRVGICVTQFDASLLERGLACHASSNKPISLIETCIIKANMINYFKSVIKSKSKFHFTVGQDTVMGSVILFTPAKTVADSSNFDWSLDYLYLDSYSSTESIPCDYDMFVLIQFEKPVVCAKNTLIISSKLDTDIHSNVCRLAFYGRVLWMSGNPKYKDIDLPHLKVYKTKSRFGMLERVNDSRSVIVKNLFKKETNIEVFQRMKVKLEQSSDSGVVYLKNPIYGHIEGNFGQSGKCKVFLEDELPEDLNDLFSNTGKRKKGKAGSNEDEPNKPIVNVILEFKRYIFDLKKKMVQ